MLGQHLIFTCYGFWLPNDPRGSGSSEVRVQHLYEIGGRATKVMTRRSVAHRKHDYQLRVATKEALKRPAVVLDGLQARAVGRGFAVIGEKLGLTYYACSIMPEHVHLVTATHRIPADKLIAALKRAATKALNEKGLHPLTNFPRSNGKQTSPWGTGGWKVFLDTDKDMLRAIRYVEENSAKAGLPRQRWSFVKPYARSK